MDRCGSKRVFGRGTTFNRFAGLGTLHALRTLVFRSRTAWLRRFQGGNGMSAMKVLRFASAARAGSVSRPSSLWRPTKCAWMFGRRPGAPCSDTAYTSVPLERVFTRHNPLVSKSGRLYPGEAGGKSHPLTRGGNGEFREWGFCLCSDDPPRRRDDDRALVVVPALGARRDRSGERPLPRQEGHRARRARRLRDVRLARARPRRPHLRRDVHQRRGSDIWPDDKNLALQLTGELLTLRSGQRAAPAARPLA